MNPGQIRVVLVEPAFGGNLGSVVRAMANMGISNLQLVGGVSPNDSDARRMAVNARYLLDQAYLVDSLAEAVKDCALVIGTTARPRKHLGTSDQLWDLGDLLAQVPTDQQVALVFGRERIGLTNEELSFCNHQITIPTFGDYASLNLAQAALLLLYECSKTFGAKPKAQTERAEAREVEGLKQHLFDVLGQIGYLKSTDGDDSLWQSFTELFNRAKFNPRDVQLLRGVCNRVQVSLGLKGPRTPPRN